MGLYPPNDSQIERFTEGMRVNVQDSFFLPFKVRDVEEINEQLGSAPLPQNFTAKAIYLRSNNDTSDEVSTTGCRYIESTIKQRSKDPTVWAKYDAWRAEIADSLEASLGVTSQEEELADFDAYKAFADTAVAEYFEGVMEEGSFFTDA